MLAKILGFGDFGRRSAKNSERPKTPPRRLEFDTLEERELLGGASLTLAPPVIKSVQTLQRLSIDGSTADKPQSKVWQHDNTWWTVLSNMGNTFLYRLDGNKWTQISQLSTTKARADAKEVGDVTHVFLLGKTSSQLVSLEYVPGNGSTPGTYKPWSQRPFPSSVPISAATGAESGTIDIDCKGRMWLANDGVNDISVRYSDAPYRTWSGPIVIDSNVSIDDISVVTAMADCKVGLLWSNQVTQRFGFRTHTAGADPAAWSRDEMPGADAAQNVGGGLADDHMNVAVASDGTLYAAVKTSFNKLGVVDLGLLIRRPSGQWDPMYTIDDTIATRPIVLLNEDLGRLLVLYAVTNGGAGDVFYTETATASIAFTPPKTLFAKVFNDPSSTKQNWTDSVVVVANETFPNGTLKPSNVVASAMLSTTQTSTPGKTNTAPQVTAGADQNIAVGKSISLKGKVKDDKLPKPPGKVTSTWTKVSGPGTVTFAKASAASTTAKFSAPGSYVLRLTADDGELQTSDEVTINVGTTKPVVAAMVDTRGTPRSKEIDSVLDSKKLLDLIFNL